MSFFDELKRRNVFRVGIAYAVSAWVLLQIVDLVLENISAPDWVMQVFMLALAIGFPVAVIFAWAFEMTPEGIKKEKDVDRSQSVTPQTGQRLNRNIIIVLVIALGWFGWDKFREEPGSTSVSPGVSEAVDTPVIDTPNPGTSNSNEKSVAVLPFVNMSDDKQNEYFSDGISEELLNVLVRVKGLRVPSRTSSFTFKGSSLKLSEIGKELQVDHILEGSVRKSGDRIRVTAQLVEVNTDTHLWSETYTRQLDDIFAVQDEISQAIVAALKITLNGSEQSEIQSRSTTSADAYNKYLLGLHLWTQRTPTSLLASIEPLLEAVALDPEFDQAWAALADSYVLIPEYGAGPIKEFIPLADEAIAKALSINPQSSRALTTSAYIKFMYDYDFEAARKNFKQAIVNDPNYATAHQWYGEMLACEGNIEAGLDELRIASEIDPLAPVNLHVMGWVSMYDNREDEARAYYHEVLAIDPYYQSSIGNLASLNMMEGKFDEARARTNQLAAILGYDPVTALAIIDALENPELKENALQKLAQDKILPEGVGGKAFNLMLLDEPELALDSLEKAFDQGAPYAVHMKRMNAFDPIRENPRFQALLKKMNMYP